VAMILNLYHGILIRHHQTYYITVKFSQQTKQSHRVAQNRNQKVKSMQINDFLHRRLIVQHHYYYLVMNEEGVVIG